MSRICSGRTTCFRRWGVADPATAIAIVAISLTAINLTVAGRRGSEAESAATEFRDNMTGVVDGMQKILQSKYERMHREGKLTKAEYNLAVHRLDRDLSEKLLRNAAQELANRQRELASSGFANLMWEATKSALYTGVGAGGQASAQRFLPDRKVAQVIEPLLDIVSSIDDVQSTAQLALQNPYVLTTNDVKAALEQAERRIQGAVGIKDTRVLLSQRILNFFDKWCLKNEVDRYKDSPNHETWVHSRRSQFQKRAHADFELLLKDLSREGWNSQASNLNTMAWDILTNSRAYRDTFGRDWSGEYTIESAEQDDGEKKTTYTFRFEDRRNGTAFLVFSLPPKIKVEDLRTLGLPSSRELRIPLTAKIDSNRSCEESFYTSGSEVQAIFRAIAKVITRVKESIKETFGGKNKEASLTDRAGAENCLLSVQPVSAESADLTLSLSAVLIVPFRKDARIELERQDFKFSGTATPEP